MANDISRFLFQPGKHYVGARMQQGRVLIDSDFNENEEFDDEDLRKDLLNVIGRRGTPQEDPGFALTAVTSVGGKLDFTIGAGTIYMGGLRFRLDQPQQFLHQTDYLQLAKEEPPPGPPSAGQTKRYEVYVEGFEQPVTAVEDKELLERGLGASAPDTSVRMRRTVRVHVLELDDDSIDDCAAGFAAVQSFVEADASTLNAESELVPTAKMTVDFTGAATADDLCSPTSEGGYLGAENQAIRVMAVDEVHIVWGFDNASPLYRIDVSSDGQTVTMRDRPRDQAAEPRAGQIVEILPAAAVLPNGEIVAGLAGQLARVTQGFDPDTAQLHLVPGAITLSSFVHGTDFTGFPPYDGAGRPTSGAPFFLRVWNQGSIPVNVTDSPTIDVNAIGTFVPLGGTGLKVKFDTELLAGSFWVIAARPESRQDVVPWSLKAGEPAHGTRRFFAPLAFIEWKNGEDPNIVDCRTSFPPLTAVKGCCNFRVGDGVISFGDYNNIQQAVDALPDEGGQICLLPGIHHGAVNITDRHHITISGCGTRSVVVGDGPSDFDGTGEEPDPVILICASSDIRLKSFQVEATGRFGIQIQTDITNLQSGLASQISLSDLDLHGRGSSDLGIMPMSPVNAWLAIELTVQDCRIDMDNLPSWYPAVFVRGFLIDISENTIGLPFTSATAFGGSGAFQSMAWGGVQIAGSSAFVTVRDNTITQGLGNGITLGNTMYAPADFESLSQADASKVSFAVVPVGLGLVDFSSFPQSLSVFPKTLQLDILGRGTETYFPRPAGATAFISMSGNTILGFGLSGIGAAGFFTDFSFVSTLQASEISTNRIAGCAQRRPVFDAAQAKTGSYGGIALGAAMSVSIADNIITSNGADQRTPICGIFMVSALDASIQSNSISENGRFNKNFTAEQGLRGGIVILTAMRLQTVLQEFQEGDSSISRVQQSLSAVRIQNNSVSQPDGKALFVTAFGPVVVEGNYLESLGDNASVAVPGFTVDVSAVPNFPAAPIQPALASTVLILDYGFALDVFQSSYLSDVQVNIVDGDFVLAVSLLANGNVQFNDNQVSLDWVTSDLPSPFPSSIFIGSLDHVMVHNNHCIVNMHSQAIVPLGYSLATLLTASSAANANQLFVHAAVLGGSVSVKANRFTEGRSDAIVSLVVAVFPQPPAGPFYPGMILENVFTHCFLPPLGTSIAVVDHNVITFPPAGFPPFFAATTFGTQTPSGAAVLMTLAPGP